MSATGVSAQDIRWKPEQLKSGDYVSILQKPGGLIHHVFAGKVRSEYLIESYRGKSPVGEPDFVTYLDKDGNYLKWQRADGFEVQYAPHDCTRVIGECCYTQTDSNGNTEQRTRVTLATRRGFKFTEFGSDGKELFGGKIGLIENGFAGTGFVKGPQGKTSYTLKARYFQ